MTLPDWREEPIQKRHNRAAFDCGNEGLNAFLREHARTSDRKGGAKTYVAVAADAPTRCSGWVIHACDGQLHPFFGFVEEAS